jgi:hypothetical protein
MRVNLRPFVPEGLIDSSLAVYCLGRVKKASRPVRDGMIWSARLDMLNGAVCRPQNRAAVAASNNRNFIC